jgi:hypothetical protein
VNRASLRTTARAAWLSLTALAFALGGCASATTSIGTVLSDPEQYDGEAIRVRGEVTESFAVPFVGGGYRVNDGTGTLAVVSSDGAPAEGATVEVRGTFRSVFTLGTENLSVLEEGEREVQ